MQPLLPRVVPVELRAADVGGSSPGRLAGTILPIGRVAGDRREVFTPGSVEWPAGGVRLLLEHRGREFMRTVPLESDGEIRIDAALPDTAEGREAAEAVRSGKRPALSVEFHALDDGRVQGVREVRRALVDAAALVPSGAYDQARAEVRHAAGRRRRYR